MIKILFLFLALTLFDFAEVVANEPADSLKKMVTKQGIPASQLFIWVYDAHAEKKIFGVNDEKVAIPASLSKIATASATLKTFPPGFQFNTLLVSNGVVNSGTLQGSLYLKGGGDPSFTSEKMWFLVNEFIRNDIKTIQGDLVVDDSLFDSERYDEDRDSVRVDRAYDAPIGAMSFNWNSVNVYVRPGKEVGAPAVVKIDPINSYIELSSTAKTGKAGSEKTIAVSRTSTAKGDKIAVSGNLAANSDEIVIYKSITKPELWSAYNLLDFLKQRGISVTGDVKVGTAPSSARVLAKAPSYPIGQIVTDMMKFSNNYVAEMLTKNMGSYESGGQGTMKKGVEHIRRWIEKLSGVKEDYKFVNPSGLTNENRMSAAAIGGILESLRNDFRVFPEFLSSYPIAGIDGTLKRRLAGTKAEGLIRAKTGLLKQAGVIGLAGYAQKPGGHGYTFVFLLNSGKALAEVDSTWRFFDSMAAELVK